MTKALQRYDAKYQDTTAFLALGAGERQREGTKKRGLGGRKLFAVSLHLAVCCARKSGLFGIVARFVLIVDRCWRRKLFVMGFEGYGRQQSGPQTDEYIWYGWPAAIG